MEINQIALALPKNFISHGNNSLEKKKIGLTQLGLGIEKRLLVTNANSE